MKVLGEIRIRLLEDRGVMKVSFAKQKGDRITGKIFPIAKISETEKYLNKRN